MKRKEYTILGLYKHVDSAASSVSSLRESGISRDDIKVLSVAPYPEGTFFQDKTPSAVWIFALAGGLLGFCIGLLLSGGAMEMMNLRVGGKAIPAIPPIAVVTYELTLLGCVLGTVFGMLYFIGLPNWTQRVYDPAISYGSIGLLVRCLDSDRISLIEEVMRNGDADKVRYGSDDF